MSYKRRISNLLQKIQEAETAGAKTLAIAIIGKREDTGKWEVHADLWDGVKGGGLERITMECDTREEAEKAVADIDAAHPGKRGKEAPGAVVFVDNMAWCE